MIFQIPNTNPAMKLGYTNGPKKVHLQVLTAAVTVRIAKDRDTLENPQPFAGQQGLQFTQTSGVVEMEWNGDIWAEGVAANASSPQIDFSIQG